MLKPGTKIEMIKGYKGVEGIIIEDTDSSYELYIVALNNGINIVAGPSAFMVWEEGKEVKK